MKPSADTRNATAVLISIALVCVVFAGIADVAGPGRTARAQTQGASCGPMDVAFIIDDTGSMFGALNNVKFELTGILGDIATVSGGDYQLALVSLRNDRTFYDEVIVRNTFAPGNALSVKFNILGLTAEGGFSEPEASDEALNTVINELPAAGRIQNADFTPGFRPAALKIVILVTDARPGGSDDTFQAGIDDVAAHQRAVEAAARGVRISAIQVPPFNAAFDPVITSVMQDYAATSGGSYIRTAADGSGTAQAIREIIGRCGRSGAGPDLTVTKTAKPGQSSPVAGGYYAFILRVKNTGTEATPAPPTDVLLRDDLSGVGTFAGWTASAGVCSSSGSVVECRRGRLAPGEEWWVEVRVRLFANRGCELLNRAFVDPWDRIREANENNNTGAFPVSLCEQPTN